MKNRNYIPTQGYKTEIVDVLVSPESVFQDLKNRYLSEIDRSGQYINNGKWES